MARSSLHGFGAFAVTDIPKGARIPDLDINGEPVFFNWGRVGSQQEFDDYNRWARREEQKPSERAWRMGRGSDGTDWTLSMRSDTPRANVSQWSPKYATRPIRRGQELLVE
jgi:hypothetical protein